MQSGDVDDIDRELLAISYGNLKPMLGMNVLASAGASLILWFDHAHWVWMWFVGAVALTIMRFVAGSMTTCDAILHGTSKQYHLWRRQYGIGLYASAAAWATLSLLVSQAQDTGHYMVTMILSALAAGGSGIIATLRREGRIYIAATLGPASLLLFDHSAHGLIMSFLGLVFLGVMMLVHNGNYQAVRHGIALKMENMALVHDLQALNADLEHRIEERTEELVNAANSDSLTGLPNRRRLLCWMHTHLDATDSRQAAALFLDLDRFKQINDAMGHGVGDGILQAVVARLSALVPPRAMLARWGGDEFVLVLGHRDDASIEAERVSNALIDAVHQPFEIGGQTIGLGLSVGMAMFPADAPTHEALILAADLAVAEVKRQGRGKLLSFCESYAETQKRHFDVSRALFEAIEIEQLVLHYQPIISCRTGNIHSYEALARWNHPVLGAVSPDEFIPIAEESDGIIALGDFVLRRACADAASWTKPDFAPRVAVNVSVKQLREPDFALRVAQILAQAGLPAGRLELEVTESIFADDHLDATRASIESLCAIGVSLAIDDFGTGYSSLSRLLRLPVSAVKIDKSFVSALDGNGGAVIESTLLIAQRLGISVIAEGVETEEQFDGLAAMGVELFQGFYFGKPAPTIVSRHDLHHEIKRFAGLAGR